MSYLKPGALMSVFCLLITTIGCVDEPSAATSVQRFEGAWFSVRYPGDFRVRPSLKSLTADGYDSVFFHAPDDRVVFYAFVPQWGGVPDDIALDPERETLISQERKSGKGSIVTWRTTVAKDGSYTRTDQTTASHDHTRLWSVGVQFRTQQDFDDYRTEYLDFKRSITRYGD